jgi:hypothetical protein
MFSAVPSSPAPKTKTSPAKVTSANKVFWARPANAELDRSGDWLFKNLTITRARNTSRAGPA